MENMFIECAERTEFSDEFYSVVGRAIYVMQQYESKCKALALFDEILVKRSEFRDLGISVDDNLFVECIEKLTKSKQLDANITKISKTLNLESDLKGLLMAAKNARNTLAHEICLGIEQYIDNTIGRNDKIKIIFELVSTIAKADAYVSYFLQLFNKDDLPSLFSLENYPIVVANWVCNTYGN